MKPIDSIMYAVRVIGLRVVGLVLVVYARRLGKGASRVVLAPGVRCLAFLRWLPVSNKSIDRVFAPVVSDLQREYIEAVAAGKKGRARMIRLRYYAILSVTFWTFVGASFVKRVVTIWKLI